MIHLGIHTYLQYKVHREENNYKHIHRLIFVLGKVENKHT